MHLQKVPGVHFDHKLEEIERALTPNYMAMFEVFYPMTPMFALIIALIAALMGAGVALAMALGMVGGIAIFYGGHKFLSNKLYLPDGVVRFRQVTKPQRNSISSRARQLNRTLANQGQAQRLLPAAEQENDEDLAAFWEEQRKSLQQEADDFVACFRLAASNDLRRVEERRGKNRKLLLAAFRDKAEQLKQLEQSLAVLNTDNLSPYRPAVKLRRQLELERLKLEKLGVSKKALQKALPPRKKQPKLLKAKT